MKPMTLLCLLAVLITTQPAFAAPIHPATSTQQLKKEISAILHKQDLEFLQENVEKVTVEFLINARNEIVVLHVDGDHEGTCEAIKKILGYQPVRYQQPRQLMRYTVDLRLVK
jgi:hypothetical protein